MAVRVWPAMLAVVSVWLAAVFAVVVGSWFHLTAGLHVWYMGQDKDWYMFLMQGPGALASEQEFIADHRNPLSGWVYSVFSPLILSSPSGMHTLHLLTCLFLGLSATLLSWQLARQRETLLPALVGATISLWWFWSYVEQVVWMMLFVYALSLLSVYCFCVYVDSDRTKPGHFAWSVILWLIALGTYTVQSGAIIAFTLISLFRNPVALRKKPVSTTIKALFDVLPHIAVAAVFVALWMTSSMGFFNEKGIEVTTHVQISWTQLLLSVQELLWHPDLSNTLSSIVVSWPWPAIAICWLITTALVFFVVRALARTRLAPKTNVEVSIWLIVVSLSLAAPTVLLESTSQTWLPGLRSKMLYSAFTPCVVLGVVSLLASLFRQANLRSVFILVVGSMVAGTIFLGSVKQNRDAIASTRWVEHLAKGLRPLQDASPTSLHFLVINNTNWRAFGWDSADRFVQVALNRVPLRWSTLSSPNETTLRIIETGAPSPFFPGQWRIGFGSDQEGVTGALYSSGGAVPYSSVRLVRFDGWTVTSVADVDAEDVKGMQADMNRDRPAHFSTTTKP